MPNPNLLNIVDEAKAGEIHALLAEVMEASLKKQLVSGEVDNGLIRNVVTYLNNNNITVTPVASRRLSSLAELAQSLDFDLADTRY